MRRQARISAGRTRTRGHVTHWRGARGHVTHGWLHLGGASVELKWYKRGHKPFLRLSVFFVLCYSTGSLYASQQLPRTWPPPTSAESMVSADLNKLGTKELCLTEHKLIQILSNQGTWPEAWGQQDPASNQSPTNICKSANGCGSLRTAADRCVCPRTAKNGRLKAMKDITK